MKNLTENELGFLYEWSLAKAWCLNERKLKEIGWHDQLERKKLKQNLISDLCEIYAHKNESEAQWQVDLDILIEKISEMNEKEYQALVSNIAQFWQRKFPVPNPN